MRKWGFLKNEGVFECDKVVYSMLDLGLSGKFEVWRRVRCWIVIVEGFLFMSVNKFYWIMDKIVGVILWWVIILCGRGLVVRDFFLVVVMFLLMCFIF